jgi:hypothetical protein
MILRIETNFSFSKLKSQYKKIQKDFISDSVNKEAVQMKKRISTGTTISGAKMDAIKDSTSVVRDLNKHSTSTPPLNASGKLKNSIKAQKKGIKFVKYGVYHNKEYKVKNNPVIPAKGKAVPKGMKRKRFFFEGKTVPARKWLHDSNSYKADKESLKEYFTKINKALKSHTKKIYLGYTSIKASKK